MWRWQTEVVLVVLVCSSSQTIPSVRFPHDVATVLCPSIRQTYRRRASCPLSASGNGERFLSRIAEVIGTEPEEGFVWKVLKLLAPPAGYRRPGGGHSSRLYDILDVGRSCQGDCLEGELPHAPAVAPTRAESAASHARPCKSELGGRRFAESQNPLLK